MNKVDWLAETLYRVMHPEAWIAPTLLNSWVNVVTEGQNAGYYKDGAGRVWLRGLVKNGTIGQPIFNLPAGYRPEGTEYYIVLAYNAGYTYSPLYIYSNGDVIAYGNATSWIPFSGISFRTS